MTVKDWVYNKTENNEKSLVKRLLISRGIETEDDINEFLNPLEMKLTQPEAF